MVGRRGWDKLGMFRSGGVRRGEAGEAAFSEARSGIMRLGLAGAASDGDVLRGEV
jgi:hypothetical protein